jgi:uncharacterized membrane protein
LFPFLFADIMVSALLKLHLSAPAAVLLVLAIFLGGLINIPVKRIVRNAEVPVFPFAVFGFFGFGPRFRRVRMETVIAVNVGGCLVPTGLAIYETAHILAAGAAAAGALGLAVFASIAVCYALARPIPGVGIALPALVPPLLAALLAVLLAPEHATPLAFVAGVLGPLVGADLLHLGKIELISTGMASIGGAGTFDGIVLSGIVAAYLA